MNNDAPTIAGVILTNLKRIQHPNGDVFHGMRKSDPGYSGFGEGYFSSVKQHTVKGWKRHKEMTLNLIVPVGAIKFVLFDDRPGSLSHGAFYEVELSPEKYRRLTVPPMIWVGFQGVGRDYNLLLNIASIEHHPDEAENRDLSNFEYQWSTT